MRFCKPIERGRVMDRLPNLPDKFNRHLLLNCKGFGSCHSLTGKILLTMVMVDDDCGAWTASALAAYKEEQLKATQKMQQEAAQYGASLSVAFMYCRCRVNGSVSLENFNQWAMDALSAAGLPEHTRVCDYLKQTYNVKEAPVFFCVNYPGRSFAIEWNQGEHFEYSVLYSEHADYRHELYHLFGATDFYCPDRVNEIAEKYFPNSIMRVSDAAVTDNLTAYLIGWTDRLNSTSRAFLEETAWVGQSNIDCNGSQQSQTGYGTIRWGDGTYTGELVDGAPHGLGRILWDDGNTYEGQWQNGCGNGQGTLVWNVHNCSYAGQWKDWEMHGYGTYTYPDGTVQTGYWEYGEYIE